MLTNTIHHHPGATAQALATLDQAMRTEQPMRAAVRSRVKFMEQAVRLRATRRLNRLGGLCRGSMLSERSIDLVFEDARYASLVVAGLVNLVDRDPEFGRILDAEMGPAVLHYWRFQAKHGPLAKAS